jgi:hypothetical protein
MKVTHFDKLKDYEIVQAASNRRLNIAVVYRSAHFLMVFREKINANF